MLISNIVHVTLLEVAARMNHPSHAASAILVFLGLQAMLLRPVHLHRHFVVRRDVEEGADHAGPPVGPDVRRTVHFGRGLAGAIDVHCGF